jgi:hypothetical protein
VRPKKLATSSIEPTNNRKEMTTLSVKNYTSFLWYENGRRHKPMIHKENSLSVRFRTSSAMTSILRQNSPA